jgi:hypothetical protein
MQFNNRKYYYIVAGLPDVHLGQATGLIRINDFIEGLKEELHP